MHIVKYNMRDWWHKVNGQAAVTSQEKLYINYMNVDDYHRMKVAVVRRCAANNDGCC